ncbi:hypothetical protein CANINC_003145 [Pichia inconspicua]|uniref:FAD dependent oxidoreductase domain-containing protein n=1 Tax=Pichia inconspicua TaxID=52247 RepID=A0A4T0WZG0_9ASCO|nr:hypothetical protein CANINC_003145 [[Candida] inconspicua]
MDQESVLIVGCGVFGLSTALELARKGKHVCVIDKYEPPSPWSAANDFNKIIRCEYNNKTYAKLAVEALHLWRSDPLYKKSFKECGRLLVTPMNHKQRETFESEGIKNIQDLGEGLNYQYLTGSEEVASRFSCFAENNIPNEQQVKFNPEGGLGVSNKTLNDVYNLLKSLPNVRFYFGDNGTAVNIQRKNNGEAIITATSGLLHTASIVIIAAGANTGSILNLENQQSATGLFVTHIQLNKSEYMKYAGMPVVYDSEIAYFFPPDSKTKIMKLCVTGSGIKRVVGDPHNANSQISLPRYHNENPKDTIPLDLIPIIKKALIKYVPELQNHKLFGSKICWVADRENSNFLIDKVPNYSNLYVATGDSGHGFKFFPNIGKYIVEMIDGNLDSNLKALWRWESRIHMELVDPAKSAWRTVKRRTRDLSELHFVKEFEKSKF